MRIRILLPALAALALLSQVACSRAADTQWPSKPVRLIVPFSSGSGVDLVARQFAPLLAERWGQAVVVDNRPGSDTIIGMQAFVASTDEHTLLFTPGHSVTLVPLQHEHLPFDPAVDVVPVAPATRTSMGIATTRSIAASSLAELITLVRAEPGKYRWAAAPGMPELIFSAFLELEGLEMTHVAYREIPNAARDLGAARIHVMVASVTTIKVQLQQGAAQLVAVLSAERSPFTPHVPTVIEAGYPALAVDGPWGFFGWRGMPEALRVRIAQDVQHAASDTGLAAALARMDQVAAGGTAAEFASQIAEQRARIAAIARIAGGRNVRVP